MRRKSSGMGSFARFGIRPHYVRINRTFRGGIRL